MNEVVGLSTDLPTITAEINAYKRVAGEAIFEVGRRLKSVRDAKSDSAKSDERKLALQREEAGGWIRWLSEHVDFDRRQANNFITVYTEVPSDVCTYTHLGFRALYEIATLPPDERDREHTLKSGESKRPDEMTVRELREVKAALKLEREAREEAEARAEKAEDDYELVCDTLEAVREQPPRTEYVMVGDTEYDPLRVTSAIRINGNVQRLSEAVGDLLERFGFFHYYDRQVDELNDQSKDELRNIISALDRFTSSLDRALSNRGYVIQA